VKLGEQSAETISDPLLQTMDKSIKEVDSILEKMKALAAAAQSDKLTKLDRMEMQIEMEDLRKDLREAMTASHLELAEMLGIEKGPLYSGSMELKSPALPGEDERSVLQRARDRLVKGEEWNVAEAYEVIESEDGERAGGQWVVLNDTDDTGDPTVRKKREIDLTVRQKLEKSNTIILMDAKSAAEGVERLEEEIGKVDQMHKKFTRFAQKYQSESSDKAGTDVADILKTPKGGMFESIERLFKGLLGRLAGGVVSEAGAPRDWPVTGKLDEGCGCLSSSLTNLGAAWTGVVPEAGSEGAQIWAGVNSAMMTEIMARIGFEDESLRMYHVSSESTADSMCITAYFSPRWEKGRPPSLVSAVAHITVGVGADECTWPETKTVWRPEPGPDNPSDVYAELTSTTEVGPDGKPVSWRLYPVKITKEDPEFYAPRWEPVENTVSLQVNGVYSTITLQRYYAYEAIA
jgi:hypothetical protein